MDIEEIFKKGKKMGYIKDIKRKINYSSEFNNSQLFCGLNNDKKGLKDLIKIEKEIEEKSKIFLGEKFSRYSDYTMSSFYVNFQYLVEFLNIYGRKLGLTKKILEHNNNGWDDLYISLRLILMGHYRTSFFHVRSFIENYFELVWKYCEKSNLLCDKKLYNLNLKNKKTGETTNSITPRMKYFSYSGKDENFKNLYDISVDYYFHGEELAKIYNYLSKFTHLEKSIKENYSYTLKYDDKYLDTYFRLGGVLYLIIARMIYAIMGNKIENYWQKEIRKPIPYEHNQYFSIFGSLMKNDIFLFNLLYEKKEDRDFFLGKKGLGLKIERLYPDAKEKIKERKKDDKFWKKAKGDKEKYFVLKFGKI